MSRVMPGTAKPRRRYQTAGRRLGAQATRDSILQAARSLFAERGFAGTTIEAIAAEKSLVACTEARASYARALQKQNAAVETLRAEASRAGLRLSKALQEARRAGEGERGAAARVLAKRPGPDACRSADELILESLTPDRLQ